jgi:tetratricopeptide (TPR) repeat protein
MGVTLTTMTAKRFRIAFSFAGEKRAFVKQVADLLAARFGEATILYDKYHEAEFARNDLNIYLPKLYNQDADLVVVIVCPQYDEKDWTGLEWLAIHDLLKQRRREEVLLSRFDRAQVDGLFSGAGFIELDHKTPEETATLILERLALNEGLPKSHYTGTTTAKSGAAIGHSSLVSPHPSNLPGGYIGQLFLGREEFLAELRASLLKQTHATAITQQRAATGIEGLGGLGKTHAAVEYAHRHRADYTALLFVSGDSPQRLNASLASLCEVLRLNEQGELPPDEGVRVSTALHWLTTHKDWLLIVDNVDDEASAQALTAYFDQLTSGHVLITSRLKSFSHQVDPLDLAELREADATDLLLQLTDRHRRKSADDAAQAGTLAKRMEGLPLALQQAAGYINEQRLTLAQYLVRYEEEAATLLEWFDGLRIPYEGPHKSLDKLAPKPVLITWKASFDKLDAEAKFWLLVFSHFAPESIPEFLFEDAPDAKDEVKTLHRSALKAIAQAEKISLLTRYDEPPRFKLHRLVQEVTRMSASEEERGAAIEAGIEVIAACKPGDPQDVRTWKQWTPLQPHALALCQHARDEPAPKRLTWLLGCLSLLLESKSLFVQAEPHIRRALLIDEASYGPDHPKVAIRLNNLAQLLQDTNRLAEAEPLMRRALQIDEASFGPEHPKVALRLNNLAQLLKATNRRAEAEPLMRRALKIDEASYGPDHPTVANRLNNLASLLQATNRLAEAEPLYRRALQIDEASFGPDHPDVAIDLNNLAQLLQATNRLTEAEPLFRRAFGIFVRSLGVEHPNSQGVQRNYIGLLQEMEVPEEEIGKRVREAVGGVLS